MHYFYITLQNKSPQVFQDEKHSHLNTPVLEVVIAKNKNLQLHYVSILLFHFNPIARMAMMPIESFEISKPKCFDTN